MNLGPVRTAATSPEDPTTDPLYSQTSAVLGNDDIRLLTLRPGRSGLLADPIDCRLDKAVLPRGGASTRQLSIKSGILTKTDQPTPLYNALSYQWGSPVRPKLIKCNGIPVYVTRSLYSALLHLRDESRAIVLWADAICINQRDDSEKAQQVQRMGDIYRHSARTIIWLGEGGMLSRQGFRACHPFADYARHALSEKLRVNADQQHTRTSMREHYIEAFRASPWSFLWQLGTILRLLRQPYFTRVWIIQEIALSPELDLACGHDRLSFTEFSLGVFPILNTKLGGPNAAHVSHIMAARSLLSSGPSHVDHSHYFAQIAQRELWVNKDILTLLTLFRRNEATLDVDKVYSLLGLAEEIRPGSTYGIPVEYSQQDRVKSTEAAFISVARRILAHQNSLRLFGVINRDRTARTGIVAQLVRRLGAYIGISRRTGTDAGLLLPSWVPDWSDRSECGTVMMPPADFSATPRTPYNFSALNHNASLGSCEIKLSGHLLTHCDDPVSISQLGDVCDTQTAQTKLRFKIRRMQMRFDPHRLDTLGKWWRTFNNEETLDLRDEFLATITCGHSAILPGNELAVLTAAILDPPRRQNLLDMPPLLQLASAFLIVVIVNAAVNRPSAKANFISGILCLGSLYVLFYLLGLVNRLFPGYSDGDTTLLGILTASVPAVESRRLARLSSGRLALVPRMSLVGDVVALCRGGHVPLLLREHGVGRHFELVGECYIHEAMDGSLFQMDECRVISLV